MLKQILIILFLLLIINVASSEVNNYITQNVSINNITTQNITQNINYTNITGGNVSYPIDLSNFSQITGQLPFSNISGYSDNDPYILLTSEPNLNVNNSNTSNYTISWAGRTAPDANWDLWSTDKPSYSTVSYVNDSNSSMKSYVDANNSNQETKIVGKEPIISQGVYPQIWAYNKTFQNITTDWITEGLNLFFTNTRAVNAVQSILDSINTTVTNIQINETSYDKLDGSRLWTGDHNAGGKNLTNIYDILGQAGAYFLKNTTVFCSSNCTITKNANGSILIDPSGTSQTQSITDLQTNDTYFNGSKFPNSTNFRNDTLQNSIDGKEPTISAGGATQFWNGLKQWVALSIGNVTGLQETLDAINATSAANDTASRARDDAINSTKLNKSDLNSTAQLTEQQVTNLTIDLNGKWNKTDNINTSIVITANQVSNFNQTVNLTFDKNYSNLSGLPVLLTNSTVQIAPSQITGQTGIDSTQNTSISGLQLNDSYQLSDPGAVSVFWDISGFFSNSGNYVVGIGSEAGRGNTGDDVVAIGDVAGSGNTGTDIVVIGHSAGDANHGDDVIAIGNYAGYTNIGHDVVAIGNNAGNGNTGNNSVFIGQLAGSGNILDYQFCIKENSINPVCLIGGNFSTGVVNIPFTNTNVSGSWGYSYNNLTNIPTGIDASQNQSIINLQNNDTYFNGTVFPLSTEFKNSTAVTANNTANTANTTANNAEPAISTGSSNYFWNGSKVFVQLIASFVSDFNNTVQEVINTNTASFVTNNSAQITIAQVTGQSGIDTTQNTSITNIQGVDLTQNATELALQVNDTYFNGSVFPNSTDFRNSTAVVANNTANLANVTANNANSSANTALSNISTNFAQWSNQTDPTALRTETDPNWGDNYTVFQTHVSNSTVNPQNMNASNLTSGTIPTTRLSTNTNATTINFLFDGDGSVLSASNNNISLDYSGTIINAVLLADMIGDATVNITRTSYTNFPNSFAPMGNISMTALAKTKDTTLSGWNTSIYADDIINFNLSGTPANITRLTVKLYVQKN